MKHLSIIIPYRDRGSHLKKIVPHLRKFIKNIEFDILVVEQSDDKRLFNKSRLMNIGFLETQDKSDYFCFHDVDCLPCVKECDYSYVEGVSKLAYSVSALNFQPRPYPPNELGGVVLINKESFLKVNGWCNAYWGWGKEDDDFGVRCQQKNIKNIIRKGRYVCLPHKTAGDTLGGAKPETAIVNERYLHHAIQNNTLFDDGVKQVKYTVVESQEYTNYRKITVEV